MGPSSLYHGLQILTERVDRHVFSPLDQEVIQVVECFRPIESSVIINRGYEDGGGVEKCLSMKIFGPNFVYCCILTVFIICR